MNQSMLKQPNFNLNCQTFIPENVHKYAPLRKIQYQYKTQRCRSFYQNKVCPYGLKCTFRHEFRSFAKLHKYFYVTHLYRLKQINQHLMEEELEESMANMAYISETENKYFQPVDLMGNQSHGLRPRLNVFKSITDQFQAEQQEVESCGVKECLSEHDSGNSTEDDTSSQKDSDLNKNWSHKLGMHSPLDLSVDESDSKSEEES